MSWPLSQDYNEAIQDPRTNFSDAELKSGEVVCNALGIPMPRSGNFADVYEMRCPSGSRWAIKCFTREVQGLRERYTEISKYLKQTNLPFMVDFQYLEQGIRVRGQWYPILKMQWVEGFVLNEFVRENLDKKPILQALSQIWLRMARRLRDAKLAHCDLQHGNVMFVPGSNANSLAVKLIDYDGMCVPALAGKKSGEVGHPAYQHPERLRTGAYDSEVDRFSLLSIGTALRCLAVGGKPLWERYDNGDNLLFRQADFQAPGESPLFQELLTIGDPQAQKLVTELFRACQKPLSSVPLLTDLMPEEKPAGKVTRTQAASSVATQVGAAASGPDWDFGDEEPAAAVVKKPRQGGGMPLWAWGAMGGAAAVVLLSVGVGLSLFLRQGPSEKASNPVAQNRQTQKAAATSSSRAQEKEDNPQDSQPDKSAPAQTPNDRADNAKPSTEPGNPVPPGEVARKTRIFQLAPGGDLLAFSEEGDKTWKLIDARTNQVVRTFAGHEGPLTGIAFSAGRRALTGSEDGMARLWDVETGAMIRAIPGRTPLVMVALSPDAQRAGVMTTRDTRGFQIWDLETSRPHGYGFSRRPTSLAFAPDNQTFLAGLDRGDKDIDQVMMFWKLGVGGGVRAFRGTPEPVTSVALSPDGKYAASIQSGATREITLWEVATTKPLWQKRLPAGSNDSTAFSPDSRFLLAGSAPLFRFFQVPSGMQVGQFALPSGTLASVGFSADGKQGRCAIYEDGKIRLQSIVLPEIALASLPSATPQPAAGWNALLDPDGDCQFQDDQGKLTITLPKAKVHDLSVERGQMNGPRLLRDIEGDFTAEVHVAGDFQKNGLQAAGLLLMADDKNYVRLERGRVGTIAADLWELRRDGKKESTSRIMGLSTLEGYVRLERRGNQVFGFVSDDGEKWHPQAPFDLDLPRKVQIGVAAISASGAFAPTFDHFRLKQGEGKWVGIEKWLAPGAAVAPSMLSWDAPVDPEGDSKFNQAEGKLTITVPNKLRVLRVEGNGKNSPRLLSDIEGDFSIQVRVGGDFTTTPASSDGGAFSWVGAGLLLWVDDNTFLRLERAAYYGRSPTLLYVNWEAREGGNLKPPRINFNLSAAETYLRLERHGKQIVASYSEDGQSWNKVTSVDVEMPSKVKIGVLAGSSSANPFTPSFDQLQLKRDQGEMVAVRWPSLPSAPAVVVTPPRRPRRNRPGNRMPAPDEATLADKQKQVRTMYRDDYKNMSKRSLANYLTDESARQGDAGLRYVMLTEARELAAQSGDVTNALRAVSRLCQQFAEDPLELKCRSVEEAVAALTAKTDYRTLTQKVLLLVDRALIQERYDLADRLLKVARTAAGKADMSTVLKQAVDHWTRQFDTQRNEYESVKPAVIDLESNPQDAEASLRLGKFRCITREDWDAGLPLLERGSDATLRELARKDLANPQDAAARAKLGDAWFEQGSKATGKEKTAYLKRAFTWYQDALEDLDRKEQGRVNQQLAKLKSQVPELARPFPDLDFVGPTVSRKVGTPLLHLRPHQVVTTRHTYQGPIEIRVKAVLPARHIRISFLNGGEISIDPDGNNLRVNFYSPFGTDAEERGNLINSSFSRLGPGPLQEIRVQIRRDGWNDWINNTSVGGGGSFGDRDYAPTPVRIWSDDAEIDIQSIVVKPIR